MHRGDGRDPAEEAATLTPEGAKDTASADTVAADAATQPRDAGSWYLPAGSMVGRYVVLGALGRGGMGMVYKAYDPELDRPIALKIVRLQKGGTGTLSAGRSRLVREAQAMARVSHPNVLPVHDAGVHDDTVFIAMEFVEGETLRKWLRTETRSWREVVDMYGKAGRGLAAAHAAGLVHRDFKPENVMVGADGRPRVLDFGLVRAAGEILEPPPTREMAAAAAGVGEAVSTGGALVTPLTRAGDVVGTPGYMAPEQYTGEDTDESTDQFSFCVALYEALYGRLPFAGNTLKELKPNVLEGNVREPPRGAKVPARVHRILLRGLSADKKERYPSMKVLLAELEGTAAPAGRWPLAAGAVAVCAVLVAVGLTGAADKEEPPCRTAPQKLRGIWDEGAQERIQAAIEAAGGERASLTWQRVQRDLDAYTHRWVKAHQAVCEATHVHHEQSAEALDLRMRCLDRRLTDVRELTAVLVEGDAKTLERAAVATGRLPDLTECDDVNALRQVTPLPTDPAARTRIAQLESQLARARALSDAGKIADARKLAEDALRQATDVGYAPLTGQAHEMVAVVDRLEGKGAGAIEHHLEALVHAERGGDDVLRAEAAIGLVFAAGYLEKDPDRGLHYARLGEAILGRIGENDRLQANLKSNRGVIAFEKSQYEEAAADFEASLAIRQKLYGADSFELVSSLNNLGSVYNQLGKNELARKHLDHAVRILEGLFGDVHPHLAAVLVNRGLARNDLGEHEEALADYRRAGRIYEAIFGADHPLVAPTLNNQADILANRGRLGEALPLYERALAVREKAYGPEHPIVGPTLLGYAGALMMAGDYRGAEERLKRVRRLYEKAYGSEHADVGRVIHQLGRLRRLQGRNAEALALFQQAIALLEKQDLSATELLPVLNSLAEAKAAAGELDDAREAAQRAIDIADAGETPPPGAAMARFVLAQVLWQDPDRRRQARALAEKARAELEVIAYRSSREIGMMDRWLADHRLSP